MKRTAVLFLCGAITILAGAACVPAAHAADTISPSVPTGLIVTAVPPSQFSLSWTASTDNAGVVGYYVYRNGVLVTAINAATTYKDGGLSSGTYSYAVAAYDGAGNVSRETAPVNGTLVKDVDPPSVPASVSVAAAATSTVLSIASTTVSWETSTDNIAVAGYYVYRDGALISTSTAVTGVSYVDWVSPGTYFYTVAAYDAAGNLSARSSPARITIAQDLVAPAIPAGLSASVILGPAGRISWSPSVDNVAVAGYYVYRGGTWLATVTTSTAYTDTRPLAGTDTYTVAAYDVAGNTSAQSMPASVTILADLVPPSVPTDLAATVAASTATLSWSPSADNVGVWGYYVYRNESQIANVTSTFYVDRGLATDAYSYAVAAYDLSNNASAESFPVVATILPQMPAAATTAPVSALPSVAASSVPITGAAGAGGATAAGIPATAPTVGALSLSGTLTTYLYYGLRSGEVKALQSILAEQGYLSSDRATGFFGTLTLGAVKKFQCDKGIICEGDVGSTGWGSVGPKTRETLNDLLGGAPSSPSAANLEAKIQALQAELQKLQSQLGQ